MEGDGSCDISTAAGEVERAHPAEAIAGSDDLAFGHLAKPAREVEHMDQTSPKRRTVSFEPVHFAEHRVSRRAPELLAEQVRDERVVAELDQLAAEPDLQVGNPHHRGN